MATKASIHIKLSLLVLYFHKFSSKANRNTLLKVSTTNLHIISIITIYQDKKLATEQVMQ